MNATVKKIAYVFLCLTLLMPGCANIQDDGTRTVVEGTGTGAGIGAALGAIFMAITGGNIAKGAAIGAAIGGVGGAAVGTYIAKDKAAYASREAWLDAQIARSQKFNAILAQNNAKLKENFVKLHIMSVALAKAYQEKKVTSAQMQKVQSSLENGQKKMNTLIQALENEVIKQKAVVADAKAGKNDREAAIIEHEIQTLEARIKELKAEAQKLANMSMRISI